MPSFHRPVLLLALSSLGMATAWAQPDARQPRIGYLCPAGGRQGTTIQIIAGGQFLNGPADVYVSGQGVHASVVRYFRPLRNIQKEQRDLLQQRLQEVQDKRLAESTQAHRPSVPPASVPTRKETDKPDPSEEQIASQKPEVTLPDHPLLIDLDNRSLRELAHIRNVLFFPRYMLQDNRQIAEMVLLEITIDPNAPPGDRELRLATNAGLTNPVVFQIGSLPEVRELEPNDQQAYPELPNLPRAVTAPKQEPLDLPVLLNGQIMPGDVDRFCFRARQGQQIVVQAHARSLIPYLADAVPGWFQATLALYNAQGKELAFADDYRFNPDPVLFYKIPRDGQYELEIRDSIYRGREDFVYRIAVGELPFITQVFPLGGQAGVPTVASIKGWNLTQTQLPLDTRPDADAIRRAACRQGALPSNSIAYAVDSLPECNEIESNDTPGDAQQIDLPKTINGRIDKPGDIDVFALQGRAGDKIVAEVYARRLNSPLDSLLRLTDSSGKVLQWNDDHVLKDEHLYKDLTGLVTHHADSYLLAELPTDGAYYLHLADSQHHGGPEYAYRLRIAAPQPRFALRVTPSSLSVRAGGVVPITLYALRSDGFAGQIEVVLNNAPPGFEIAGARIPPGRDRIRMTITAPPQAPDGPVALQLQGQATVAAQTVACPVVPADDLMQAFLYRHLVPAQQLLLAVQKSKWRAPPVKLADPVPIRIPAGGSTTVRIKTRPGPALNEMRLQLADPPEGLTLHDVAVTPQGLAFQLKADKDALQPGFADNLIIEAFREPAPAPKDAKPPAQKRRYSIGPLPAIPIEIIQQ